MTKTKTETANKTPGAEAALAAVTAAAAALTKAKQDLVDTILVASMAGWSERRIGDAAGLSGPRIHQIRKEARAA